MGEVPSPAFTSVLEERHLEAIMEANASLRQENDQLRTTIPTAPNDVGRGFVLVATPSPEIPPASLEIQTKRSAIEARQGRTSERQSSSDNARSTSISSWKPYPGAMEMEETQYHRSPPKPKNVALKILDDLVTIPFVPAISWVEAIAILD